MSDFDEWWEKEQHCHGYSEAEAAWDHQQASIEALELLNAAHEAGREIDAHTMAEQQARIDALTEAAQEVVRLGIKQSHLEGPLEESIDALAALLEAADE